MIKVNCFTSVVALSSGLFVLLFSININAEGYIKKEVYSYKDQNGNTVFTDKQPSKTKVFSTKTIESANSTSDSQNYEKTHTENYQRSYSETHDSPQTVRIIVEDGSTTKKKSYKKKKLANRCKFYKKKLNYYSDKMKSGYKNSEYKKLESNRKKYRNLLFKNCSTKTFND